MIYYRVPPEMHNWVMVGKGKAKNKDRVLKGLELYTKTECNKYHIPIEKLTKVNAYRNQIYWWYGSRYAYKEVVMILDAMR